MTNFTKKAKIITGIFCLIAVAVVVVIIASSSSNDRLTTTTPNQNTSSETAVASASNQPSQESPMVKSGPTRIRITNGNYVLFGVLDDTPAAQDFASMLPVTLDIESYSNNEVIGYPERRLSTAGEQFPISPGKAGDITYYIPWGDVAMFYRDNFGYNNDLIKLGSITEGSEQLSNLNGSTRFEIVE